MTIAIIAAVVIISLFFHFALFLWIKAKVRGARRD